MNDFSYERLRRVIYDGCWFVPVCPTCGRFVKADETMTGHGPPDEWQPDESVPNATCAKCGRVNMPCEGFV